MNYFKKFLFTVMLFLTFSLTFDSSIYCQPVQVHDLGKLLWKQNELTRNNITFPVYPNGDYRRTLTTTVLPWLVVKEWTYPEGKTQTGIHNQTTYSPSMEPVKCEMTKRFAPPSIIVDGVNMSPPYTGKVDRNIKMDVMTEHHLKCWTTISAYIISKYYTFANQYHNSYIIFDTNVKMDLDIDGDNIQDCPEQTAQMFFAHSFGFQPCEEGIRSNWSRFGDNANKHWHIHQAFPSALMAQGKIPKASRDSLVISYAYNTDLLTITRPSGWTGSWPTFNDAYDPDPKTGEFLSPQYAGYTTLYADKSVSDKSDDVLKPRTCGTLYLVPDLWTRIWPTDKYVWCDQGIRQKPEYEQGYKEPRTSDQMGYLFQTWGPYTIKNGESFNVSYAAGVGSISKELALSKGAEWLNWYKNKVGNFDNNAKNMLCAQGLDSMVMVLDRAKWARSRNYNIPDPLPVPNIKVTSGADKITVEWGYPNADYYKDPDTGIEDFKEWRLYKKRGAYEIDAYEDASMYYPYELVGTFPKSVTSYEDKNISIGVSYHYCVTAVDDGSQYQAVGGDMPGAVPLESSIYNNRTFKEAIPFKAPAEKSEGVLIVPNPYSVSTGVTNQLNYPGKPNEIHFINLPPYCTLKIYTSTGDLIKTINHTSGSGLEIWANMITDSNQLPVSGVYILIVDNAKNSNKDPLPKKMFKFVIVR